MATTPRTGLPTKRRTDPRWACAKASAMSAMQTAATMPATRTGAAARCRALGGWCSKRERQRSGDHERIRVAAALVGDSKAANAAYGRGRRQAGGDEDLAIRSRASGGRQDIARHRMDRHTGRRKPPNGADRPFRGRIVGDDLSRPRRPGPENLNLLPPDARGQEGIVV